MNIVIHRGINQIGGCITEITTQSSHIFIDMGDNLPGSGTTKSLKEKIQMVENLFAESKREHEGVFYTHSHSDHVGMLNCVPDHITQYMGQGCSDILQIKNDLLLRRNKIMQEALQKRNINYSYLREYKDLQEEELMFQEIGLKLKQVVVWEQPKPKTAPHSITVGDIKVTPYFVSHSSFDSYMFHIEAGGKRILHTGDFRDHGYLGKGLMPTLKYYIRQVDVIITEGTMLGRTQNAEHEKTIEAKMRAQMGIYKNVFVLTSSTDIEKLAAINAVAKSIDRPLFSCSSMMNRTLQYFTEYNKPYKNKLFDFKHYPYSVYSPNEKMLRLMHWKGFVMLVGVGQKDNIIKIMQEGFSKEETLLIYSCWDGYYRIPEQVEVNPNYKEIRKLFSNVVDIHTSGHANKETIEQVIRILNPKDAIIGIHKNVDTSLLTLDLPDNLKAKIVPDSQQIDWIIIK